MPLSRETLNLIDANINRAREGSRVLEDIARFVFEDKSLSAELKDFRHSLTAAIISSGISFNEFAFSRTKSIDVGAKSFSSGEKTRAGLNDVLLANIKRTQESLRVLEETLKPFNQKTAKKFKSLRYSSYRLEEKLLLFSEKQHLLKKFISSTLYFVLTSRKKSSYVKIAKAALKAGVKIIQLRGKNLSDKEIVSAGKKIRFLSKKYGALFLVDDRPDLALILGADGVHLGQDNVSVKDARSILGWHKLIGKSTHSLKQALSAVKENPDYISVGPIFPTQTVSYKPVGLSLIKKVRGKTKIPFVAIGGIKKHNVSKILKAGAERAAVVSEISEAKNPEKAAGELLRELKGAKR